MPSGARPGLAHARGNVDDAAQVGAGALDRHHRPPRAAPPVGLGERQSRLTVVSAGPGWGKSTAVAQWVASRGDVPVAWLTLTDIDDHLNVFWHDLLQAILATGAIPTDHPLSRASTAAGVPAEVMVTLHQGLAALPGPMVLVLDDFHVIEDAGVLEAVQRLVDLDSPLRLILLTRVDPVLALHRLRVEGQLVELTSRDLAFGPDEVQRMGRAASLSLTRQDVDQVLAQHGGMARGGAAGDHVPVPPGVRQPDQPVHRYRAVGQRVPAGRGAGPQRPRHTAVPAAHRGGGPPHRGTRRGDRPGCPRTGAAGAPRAHQPVRHRPGCRSGLVPLPPPAARPARAHAAPRRPRRLPGRPPGGRHLAGLPRTADRPGARRSGRRLDPVRHDLHRPPPGRPWSGRPGPSWPNSCAASRTGSCPPRCRSSCAPRAWAWQAGRSTPWTSTSPRPGPCWTTTSRRRIPPP